MRRGFGSEKGRDMVGVAFVLASFSGDFLVMHSLPNI